jgi:hypothetical protein
MTTWEPFLSDWIPFEAPCWCDDCAEHGAVLEGHTDCRTVGPSLQRWENLGYAIRQQDDDRWRWYAWDLPSRAGAVQEAALCCLRVDEAAAAKSP